MKKAENASEPRTADMRDMEQLVHWLDELEREVRAQFSSASWRVGWFIVKLLKGLLFRRHPPASTYRMNEILRAFMLWKAQRQGGEVAASPVSPRSTTHTVILAGDLGENPGEKESRVADLASKTASTRVLGFQFEGWGQRLQFGSTLPVEVVGLSGCAFPGFFEVLSSALTCSPGERLIALTPDLPGLGLGLLANFHFGTPLSLSAPDPDEAPPVDLQNVDWSDPEWMNPAGGAWRRLLAALISRAPWPADIDTVAVLPAAERFAELFAEFYEQAGSRE